MSKARATEQLSTILEERITNYYTKLPVDEIGRVVSVGDGIARVYGLNKIQAGEMVEFASGVKGMAGELASFWHNVAPSKQNNEEASLFYPTTLKSHFPGVDFRKSQSASEELVKEKKVECFGEAQIIREGPRYFKRARFLLFCNV